jgi:imidazole glycerol-phosphate synthase subunit HisH
VSPRIAVVDPGTANLDSMVRALEVVGGSPIIARLPQDLEGADRIVLPGVGAFPDAIGGLRGRGLDVAVRAAVAAGTPLLRVCLGMQLLATTGTEGTETRGLGLIPPEGGGRNSTPPTRQRRTGAARRMERGLAPA